MSSNSLNAPLVDWRLETIRAMPSKQIQVTCTGDILDTLFLSDDSMPFRNPQAAIADALSGYWTMLERASHIFSASEWKILSSQTSPLSGGGRAGESAALVVTSIEQEFPGDEWGDDMLAVKALLPKIVKLSETDFAAVNEILRYVRNLSSDDPFFTISRKLSALEAS